MKPSVNTPATEISRDKEGPKFMEVDGILRAKSGENGGIQFVQPDQRDINQTKDIIGEKAGESDIIIMDPKRRCVESTDNMELDDHDIMHGPHSTDGPKNLSEEGPEL